MSHVVVNEEDGCACSVGGIVIDNYVVTKTFWKFFSTSIIVVAIRIDEKERATLRTQDGRTVPLEHTITIQFAKKERARKLQTESEVVVNFTFAKLHQRHTTPGSQPLKILRVDLITQSETDDELVAV